MDQNEYGGDQYGGGRYGRGPFEQSQRYGEDGFASRGGAYGSLQRQYDERYASGDYSGVKTSGRALGGPPGRGGVPPRRGGLPRTSTAGRASRSARGAGAQPGPAPRRSTPPARLSDDRIRHEICERLSRPVQPFDASEFASEHLDVSDVTVSVAGGKVTLGGTVPERRMKHDIEELVDACPGVQDVENRIRVRG